MKLNYLEGFEIFLQPPVPTKENVAYTRYADISEDPASKHVFQFPRGQQYRIVNNSELFRIQKWTESANGDRWHAVRRSKSFIAAKYFDPVELKEGNLAGLFHTTQGKEAYAAPEDSEAYLQWREKVLEAVPKVNHDVLIDLARHTAYDAKVNDKAIWKAIEDAAHASLHHMSLTQVCQLEWASQELKPKQTSPRLNALLMRRALEAVEGGSAATASDMIDVLQGFRQKKNKDLYIRIRKALIERKATLFPHGKTPEEQKKRAENLVNLFFTFASNRPKDFGVYKVYALEELNELLSHYEEDLKTAAETEGLLDGEHLTRLA
jgi:hypothetical protein